MNPRSEPLLWVQLISLGAVPLELLLLVLVLAGSDPGPLPQLERLLAWALGALAPALLLWRQGADPRSLLLITAAVPLEPGLAARLHQQQGSLLPKVLFGAGVAALLPLVGWMDTHAALAGNFSPLQDGARLSALLLCVVLLALMVWQWHQLVQAGWLLWAAEGPEGGGTPDSATRPHLDPNNPGLPLLLLSPLVFPQPAADRTAVHAAAEDQPAAEPSPELQNAPQSEQAREPQPRSEPDAEPEPEPQPQPQEEADQELAVEAEPAVGSGVEDDASALPVAIEPEQPAEESQGPDLDQQIAADDLTPGS